MFALLFTNRKLLLALGLLALAGCQHQRPQELSLLSSDNSVTKLDERQTADVQVSLARSLEKQGKTPQAIQAYQEAIKRDPRRGDAHLRLAVLHDRQAKFHESASLYHRAIELAPNDPEMYCNRGYSLYLQQRWGEAEEDLRHALKLAPDCALAHNNLALVLARSGRTNESVEEFRKGGCDQANAFSNLAFVLATDGRWDEARKFYQQALSLNPALEAARTGLHKLERTMARAAQEPPPPEPVQRTFASSR